jgi:hypothetical protein
VYSIAVGALGGIQVQSAAGCHSVAICFLVVHVVYAAVYVRTLYHAALAMRCGTLVVAGLQVASAVAAVVSVFSGLTATLATVLVWSNIVVGAVAMLLQLTMQGYTVIAWLGRHSVTSSEDESTSPTTSSDDTTPDGGDSAAAPLLVVGTGVGGADTGDGGNAEGSDEL